MIDVAPHALRLAPALLRAAAPTLPRFVKDLADAVGPWKDFYADSKVAETIVLFAHLGGLLVGGGLAIAADRSTLRLTSGARIPEPDAGARGLVELSSTHRPVVIALAIVFASGVLLLLSDVETFWAAPVYWIKMALVLALLVNGFLMTRVERALAVSASGAGAWRRLRAHAGVSAALWLATTLAGVALANA